MDKKIGHPKAARKSHSKFNDNSTHSQRMLLLAWFESHDAITTIEARRDLDILMPAARIFELRKMGHSINTVWVDGITDAGRHHRVARYFMTKGGCHE